MRRLLLICGIALLAACQNDLLSMIQFKNPLPDSVQTVEEANAWVGWNIKYAPSGDWKGPAQTYLDGEGDCEDLVILLLWVVRDRFGIEGEMIVRKLYEGGYHATAYIDGVHYDPMLANVCYPPEEMIIVRMGYHETMAQVVWY